MPPEPHWHRCECGCDRITAPGKRYRAGHNYKHARLTDEQRFWAKVQKTDTCWIWLAATNGVGYGRLSVAGERRCVLAHRFSYELYVGPIPAGLEIDHLCRTPECVNPAHLEPVPHRVNVLRGLRSALRRAA